MIKLAVLFLSWKKFPNANLRVENSGGGRGRCIRTATFGWNITLLAGLWPSGENAATAKSLQSCPTLCDPKDGSPLGSAAPGILQARTLEWVAISFSNAWKWKVKVKSLSRVWPSATPWTVAFKAPPSMGFARQECWSGVTLPSPMRWWQIPLL